MLKLRRTIHNFVMIFISKRKQTQWKLVNIDPSISVTGIGRAHVLQITEILIPHAPTNCMMWHDDYASSYNTHHEAIMVINRVVYHPGNILVIYCKKDEKQRYTIDQYTNCFCHNNYCVLLLRIAAYDEPIGLSTNTGSIMSLQSRHT